METSFLLKNGDQIIFHRKHHNLFLKYRPKYHHIHGEGKSKKKGRKLTPSMQRKEKKDKKEGRETSVGHV